MSALTHTPVLLNSVLSLSDPQPGEIVLDVTLGLGGHAAAFLERIGRDGRFIGLDADAENLRSAEERLAHFSCQKEFHHGNFRELPALQLPQVDVLFADLGLSSPQVDDPKLGFNFREEVPLDLRYDRTIGQTAAAWLARASEADIVRVLREYGEVRGARRIAVCMATGEVRTTFDLKRCVEAACGWRAPSVLPQVFQALRIAINDELHALEVLLQAGPELLREGGRMVVLSYHSLEDRLVKQAFRSLSLPEKDTETGAVSVPARFALLTRKPLAPEPDEVRENPRARSAHLRALRRVASISPH